MPDQLDAFLGELQERIDKQTEERYGPKAYDRWRKPLFMGELRDPDGHGSVTGSCGDTMQLFLRFEGETVSEVGFVTDGCGSSTICGSFAAELALGKTPDELADLRGEDVLDVLGGFPEGDQHCAFLAVAALREALGDFMRKAGRACR